MTSAVLLQYPYYWALKPTLRLVTLRVRDVPLEDEDMKVAKHTMKLQGYSTYLSILCGYISRVLCGR